MRRIPDDVGTSLTMRLGEPLSVRGYRCLSDAGRPSRSGPAITFSITSSYLYVDDSNE
jgi:hypothetical protein